jgi:prophage antirepressor-like protein
MSEITTVEKVFEGQAITAYLWEGSPVWVAKQVGAAMGYSGDGERLTDLIRGEWKAEVIEGQDVELLTGERLANFKTATPALRGSSINHLLLLREPGFHLVCLKTEKKIGRRLRRWLAEEVMPSILRTGSYQANPQSAQEIFEAHKPAVLAAMAKRAEEGHVEAAAIYERLGGGTLPKKPTTSGSAVPKEAPKKPPTKKERILELDRTCPGLSYGEIARQIGTNRGVVSKALHRQKVK